MGAYYVVTLLISMLHSFYGEIQASRTSKPMDCSTFPQLAKSSVYVDKSPLLKFVFQGSKRILITAPRGFGKSVNMDMMRTFLTIPRDNQNRNESESHQLFSTLKIFKDNSFFFTHFASYPVLFLDLKVDIPIKSDTDTLVFLRNKIAASFKDHDYLLSSRNLDKELITICTKWCDKIDSPLREIDVLNGILGLVKSLKTHYNKKVFVLVDDYDSIITSFLSEPTLDISSSSDVVLRILSRLCNSTKFVEGCVFTGRTNILDDTFHLFESHRFLGNHDFGPFYGFTKKEVSRLLKKFAVVKSNVKGVKQWYNGYRSTSNESIYIPVSIINFLSGNHSIKRFWANSDPLRNRKQLFSRLPVQSHLELLLASKTVTVNLIERFEWYHLLTLRDMYCYHNATIDLDVLSSYFLDNGYLISTSDLEESGESGVKIPNLETEYFFLEEIQKSYDRFNVSVSLGIKSI